MSSGSFTQKDIAEDKIIEAGWLSLRALWLHPDTPKIQHDELRAAFFAGAKHLFAAMVNIADPTTGVDATPSEEAAMDSIHRELNNFYAVQMPTAGKA